MKEKRIFLLCLLCLIAGTNLVFAQTRLIKGKVRDDKGIPIPGATVLQKGTQLGTSTSEEGAFALNVSGSGNISLDISAIGFLSKTVTTDGQAEIDIMLENDLQSIDDQKVTRKKATASIASINGKELENMPMSSFDQLMQGRLSGVNVQNFSGDPGARAAVSVRGSTLISSSWDENNVVSSPLYVVDGVPQSNEEYVAPGSGTGMNYLAGINPNDIESIDVLKDASASAIYGSRAANGVY